MNQSVRIFTPEKGGIHFTPAVIPPLPRGNGVMGAKPVPAKTGSGSRGEGIPGGDADAVNHRREPLNPWRGTTDGRRSRPA